jgi:hypothetical protein
VSSPLVGLGRGGEDEGRRCRRVRGHRRRSRCPRLERRLPEPGDAPGTHLPGARTRSQSQSAISHEPFEGRLGSFRATISTSAEQEPAPTALLALHRGQAGSPRRHHQEVPPPAALQAPRLLCAPAITDRLEHVDASVSRTVQPSCNSVAVDGAELRSGIHSDCSETDNGFRHFSMTSEGGPERGVGRVRAPRCLEQSVPETKQNKTKMS